jgi:MFS transporter, DHA1 family, multidrug resistance protein
MGQVIMFKNKNLAVLFFTMMVVMLGFGLIIPIMPFYIEKFNAGGSEMGMMMAIFSIMQFLFSPVWGDLSDRIGRKPVMVIGALGNAISMLIFGLSNSLWMLFVSRALAGMLSSATMPTAMAFISDSTSERDRGGGMGLIGAAMGAGMVLGPGIGGWLAGSSLSTPFFVAAGLSTVAALLTALILPESLPREKRVQGPKKLQGPQMSMMWRALFGPLGFLLFLAFLVNFGLANFEGIFGLYAKETFGYSPQQVGTILVVIGVISFLIQGVLTGPATRWLGEVRIILISLLGSAIGFILMLWAASYAQVMLTVGFFVFTNAMLRPVIASLTSKVTTDGQGVTLGLNNAYQSLGRVAGPLWAGFLFDINVHLPYASASVIMFVTFCLGMVYLRKPPPVQANQTPLPAQDLATGD